MERREALKVNIGRAVIGGGAPVAIQSMTNTDTRDVQATVDQILCLEKEGCDIVRVSVYDEDCAKALPVIKGGIHIPLVADIHFDYRLALMAVQYGADKLRINPGNIPQKEKVREIVKACKDKGIPIRVGVNSGSLSKEKLERYGGVNSEAIVESALEHVSILESEGFYDIVVAVKASSVPLTVESYRLLAEKVPYPLHIGVTESGAFEAGLVKSAIGIGALLLDGIGDTIRVSLTGSPVQEITAAKHILRSVGLYKKGPEIISCPTCGRCNIPLEKVVERVQAAFDGVEDYIKIAIMGCVVNGPGEAREADIGLAGGKGSAAIFKRGELFKTVSEEEMTDVFIAEIVNELRERGNISE